MKKYWIFVFLTIMLGAMGASAIIYGEGIILGIGLASTHVLALMVGLAFGVRFSVGLIEKGVDIKSSTMTSDTDQGQHLATVVSAVIKTIGENIKPDNDFPPVVAASTQARIIDGEADELEAFLDELTTNESRFLEG